MKALYINPFIESFANILQMVVGIQPEKKEIRKNEGMKTEKSYTMYFELENGLKGFYAVSFDEELALNLVEKMIGSKPGELDEMGYSAIKEIGEMVKGNAITELSTLGIDCEAKETQISKEENKVNQESITLVMNTELGEIENHFYLKK